MVMFRSQNCSFRMSVLKVLSQMMGASQGVTRRTSFLGGTSTSGGGYTILDNFTLCGVQCSLIVTFASVGMFSSFWFLGFR